MILISLCCFLTRVAFVHSFTHFFLPFIHSFIHSFVHSFIPSLLIHILTLLSLYFVSIFIEYIYSNTQLVWRNLQWTSHLLCPALVCQLIVISPVTWHWTKTLPLTFSKPLYTQHRHRNLKVWVVHFLQRTDYREYSIFLFFFVVYI